MILNLYLGGEEHRPNARKILVLKNFMINPKKILIVQLRRIGDVLMCTPSLRALRKKFPKSYIAFLTEKESETLLKGNPYVDELIVLEKDRYGNPLYMLKQIHNIRKKSFDLTVDFFGNPRSAWICFLSGAFYRLGPNLGVRGLFYNLKIPKDKVPKYAAQSRLDGLKILGIKSQDCTLDFFLSDKAKDFAKSFFKKSDIKEDNLIISVSPISRRHFKRWSLERYAEVCDFMVSKYKAKIILVWGPEERSVVEKLKDLSKNEIIISPPTHTLQELGAILKRCDLHFGNDNGTKHIAVAVGIPTLTIYGPHSHISWTYPDKKRHKWIQAENLCSDCEKIKHKCARLFCLDSIEVDVVKKELEEFLKDKLDEKKLKKTLNLRAC